MLCLPLRQVAEPGPNCSWFLPDLLSFFRLLLAQCLNNNQADFRLFLFVKMDQAQKLLQAQQIIQDHEAQIQALHAQVQSLLSQLNNLTTALANKPARRPKPCLPDPEKFSGSQITWDTWLPSIQAKLRIDGEAIGGPEAQFFYLYGRLDGKVQALVMPQLQVAEDQQQYDPAALLRQLARLYDDPHKIRDAEDKLQSLQQSEDPLPTYLAKFERLLYKAKANLWPDTTKIALLRKGLNKPARDRLDTQVLIPDKYDDFVALLQKLSGRSSGSGSGTRLNHSGPKPEPMQIGTIGAISVKERFEQLEDSDN